MGVDQCSVEAGSSWQFRHLVVERNSVGVVAVVVLRAADVVESAAADSD